MCPPVSTAPSSHFNHYHITEGVVVGCNSVCMCGWACKCGSRNVKAVSCWNCWLVRVGVGIGQYMGKVMCVHCWLTLIDLEIWSFQACAIHMLLLPEAHTHIYVMVEACVVELWTRRSGVPKTKEPSRAFLQRCVRQQLNQPNLLSYAPLTATSLERYWTSHCLYSKTEFFKHQQAGCACGGMVLNTSSWVV